MHSRRRFIAGLGAAGLAGMAPSISSGGDAGAGAGGVAAATAEPEFLLEPGLIHLNTGTFGLMPRHVRERMAWATRRFESNPVLQGYKDAPDTVRGQAEAVRARAGTLLNCSADEVLLTHGTADGLGQVASSIDFPAGSRVLTSGAEHDAGVECWRWLARRRGGFVDVVPCPPEETDVAAILDRFAKAMRPETKVICVSDVIAWTGLRMPIRELSELAHAHGALMVVDGAQASGHVPIDVMAMGCGAYAASGHKWLLGPKGTGMLYVRKDAAQRILPVAWEDGPKVMNESTGGCPLPQMIGLGAAIEDYQRRGPAAEFARNVALRNRLWEMLGELKGITPLGPPPGAQATALLGFRLPDGVDAAKLRSALLAKHRINIRAVDVKQWNGLRASLHVYNDEAQCDALLKGLRQSLEAEPGV
jgi:selenocysteine lyase/cysteine desulfurase